MAADLNKTRMRDTRLLVLLLLLAVVFTQPVLYGWPYQLLRLLGYFLLVICAIGRMYSTAFIGGVKNEKLVTVGPYAMCRNPLYFFSLLGATGLGLLWGELVPTLILGFGFYVVYNGLIGREEGFLAEKFGADFTAFKKNTPRLWPDIKRYNAPDELLFQPRYFNMSVRDAVWWFVPAPVFELAAYLHHAHILPTVFKLL